MGKISQEILKRRNIEYKYKLLMELIDNIPDVIYIKDRTGRLLLVNKAHAKGLGLKPEDVSGKTDFDFFPKNRAKLMTKDDEYIMKTGRPIIDKIERATRADGIDNYVSTTKIPRYDKKGKVVGIMGITRDITRRAQTEHLREEKEVMGKKLKALEELSNMKSEFISIVSHELRTPLAIIQEAVLLLSDQIPGPVNERQEKLLSSAKINIQRLKHIIEELLDISRIESGRLRLHYSLVNLNDLLKEASDFFKKSAREKDITLEYKLSKKEVNIFIDVERISQVIVNLINNAIKFTGQGGKITVEVKLLQDKVRIGIIDTGIGIAKNDLARLFNKFVQLSGITSAERKGLGLGLSIVKELIDRHEGEIWVESKLGAGSRFYFTLPRFRTTDILKKDIKDKINALLSQGDQVHLINIFIVNYGLFKKRIDIKPEKIFKNIERVVDNTFFEFFKSNRHRPDVVIVDSNVGECSIIFHNIKTEKAVDICNSLRDNIKGYFIKNSIAEIFTNIGMFSYPAAKEASGGKHPLSNLFIRKVYIGHEKRRFRRVDYKADVEVIFSQDERDITESVDISIGGMAFVTKILLKTDSVINIRLKLPVCDKPLNISGRAVWIKKLDEVADDKSARFKVGMEFLNMDNKNKKILSKFIKSIFS